MNGRSASSTAEVSAAAHFHHLATFIGVESGGGYHGGGFADLILPRSQLQVQAPLANYVLNSPPLECALQLIKRAKRCQALSPPAVS